MSPAGRSIDFWFEFASTYSYLAAGRIEALAGERRTVVRWRPFLLGPIFREQGWDDSPFNVYPVKGRYMWRDMERLCEKYALPFRRPGRFPRNGLLAARVACLAASEPWLPNFVREVYRANFAEDREISDPVVLEGILGVLGVRGRDWIERAGSPGNKAALRAQTEEAARLGLFGAPSFVARGELFWGHDRLEDALDWLEAHPEAAS